MSDTRVIPVEFAHYVTSSLMLSRDDKFLANLQLLGFIEAVVCDFKSNLIATISKAIKNKENTNV